MTCIENPCYILLCQQDLSEWACIYIKYIQILRKLETAYDQMVHPQKRLDMRKALEACIGRMLEIRHWMVRLNRGLDFVSLDDILVDLKLSPEVLEVPVPKYYIEDRAKELDDRDKFLEALVEKYNVKPPQQSPIVKIGAPLPEEEAILIIQKNERGGGAAECVGQGRLVQQGQVLYQGVDRKTCARHPSDACYGSTRRLRALPLA